MMFPIPDGCGPLLRLQVVVAHPDDETFGCGSILLQAARSGACTGVTCATRGEAGEVAPGVQLPDTGLAGLREAELHEAARLLGVRQVELLGFRDSGMEGEPEQGTLASASEAEVLGAVQAAVEAFRPDVLVTLDGSDGHRDHARVRDATIAAGASLGIPVYLQCLPRSTMQQWAEHMATVNPELAYLKLEELGTPDEEISVAMDVHALLAQRWEAIRAHRSQTSPFHGLPDELAEQFLGWDHLLEVRG